MPARQDQARLTLILDGKSYGVWDDKTGGDTDTNSSQYFLGGMGPRISLGGPQQVNNLVLQRLQTDEVRGFGKQLTARAGKAQGTLSEQGLDDDGNPVGDPFVWKVRLKRAKPSDVQSQSNSAAQFEVELEVDGQMA